MTIEDLERLIWLREGIRVVVRFPSNHKLDLKEYPFLRKAPESWRIERFIERRLAKILKNIEFTIVSGDRNSVLPTTILQDLRETYD